MSCCIVKCSARKDKNLPQLTLHKLPSNVIMRKKWIDAIGEENLNPRHKVLRICSLHFKEQCFNRTLEVIRLRDDAVPSIFVTRNKLGNNNICETSSTSTMGEPVQSSYEIVETIQESLKVADKLIGLKGKFLKQRRIIKNMREKVRKRDIKIANLNNIIKDLQERNKILEQALA